MELAGALRSVGNARLVLAVAVLLVSRKFVASMVVRVLLALAVGGALLLHARVTRRAPQQDAVAGQRARQFANLLERERRRAVAQLGARPRRRRDVESHSRDEARGAPGCDESVAQEAAVPHVDGFAGSARRAVHRSQHE